MLNKLLFHNFPTLKSWLTHLQYELISHMDRDRKAIFMNFGYTSHHRGNDPLPLSPEDEPHRYPLQLYHHVANAIEWTGRDALEVSSGRGGGAHFIMQHFKPRSFTGVDFSSRAVEFCRRAYRLHGLSFQHGNAEHLPFPDHSFDVVMNVEASLYYPNITRFFDHVKRVLRPEGHFLYTDLRYEEKIAIWHAQLKGLGLRIIKEEDITANVLKAMELDRGRRLRLIQTYVPKILQKSFYHFAGLKPNAPLDGIPHLDNRRYWNFVLQKVG